MGHAYKWSRNFRIFLFLLVLLFVEVWKWSYRLFLIPRTSEYSHSIYNYTRCSVFGRKYLKYEKGLCDTYIERLRRWEREREKEEGKEWHSRTMRPHCPFTADCVRGAQQTRMAGVFVAMVFTPPIIVSALFMANSDLYRHWKFSLSKCLSHSI